ncbi:MAG TPA: cytochrome c maturation protein CcmE [Abditibacteriaceae bacterium]
MKTSFPIRFVVGPLLIAAALVWLVTSSMRASTLRVVPVEELRHPDKADHAYVGQRLRVAGFVSAEGAQKSQHKTSNGIVGVSRFRVTDEEGHAALLVEYRDALPDTFRKGGPVQVDGVYEAGGTMRAEHVFTKCPSKYEEAKAAKQKGQAAKAQPVSTRANALASALASPPAETSAATTY